MVDFKIFIKKNNKIVLGIIVAVVMAVILTVGVVAINGSKTSEVLAATGAAVSGENIITVNPEIRSASRNTSSMENIFADSNSNSYSLPVSGITDDVNEYIASNQECNEVASNDDDAYELDYSQLAIADVTNYVNVRSEPNETSEIVGYIYKGAVANIEEKAGENGEWFKINSGNVNGYIKAEFFIAGDAAGDVIGDYVTNYATVICDRLNVRQEANVDSSRIGYIENGEKVKIKENQGEWLVVEYLDGKTGYVASEFVSITEEFTYARTIEEDKAIKAEEAALLARETDNSGKSKENLTKYIDTSVTPADTFGSNAELRKAICDYATQFVGLPYVYGGNSLATGTDCSGFTMLVYKHFGYNISRIPQGQLDGVGRRISYDEIQPGDIVLYSSKGIKATHAALYIGNGKVVHETNHRYGVLITSIDWIGPVWGIKNVID